jgi:hypothetical protein
MLFGEVIAVRRDKTERGNFGVALDDIIVIQNLVKIRQVVLI